MRQETILSLALGFIFIGGSFVGVTGLPPHPGMYYLYGGQSIEQAYSKGHFVYQYW